MLNHMVQKLYIHICIYTLFDAFSREHNYMNVWCNKLWCTRKVKLYKVKWWTRNPLAIKTTSLRCFLSITFKMNFFSLQKLPRGKENFFSFSLHLLSVFFFFFFFLIFQHTWWLCKKKRKIRRRKKLKCLCKRKYMRDYAKSTFRPSPQVTLFRFIYIQFWFRKRENEINFPSAKISFF